MSNNANLTDDQRARYARNADRAAQQYELWAAEWRDRPSISADYEKQAEQKRKEAEELRNKK